MALTRFTEIKANLVTEMSVSTKAEIEDRLSKLADDYIPVYYSDILAEWAQMPAEFNDSWKDNGLEVAEQGIIELMRLDLYAYYSEQVSQAYEELTAPITEAYAEAQARIDSFIHL